MKSLLELEKKRCEQGHSNREMKEEQTRLVLHASAAKLSTPSAFQAHYVTSQPYLLTVDTKCLIE